MLTNVKFPDCFHHLQPPLHMQMRQHAPKNHILDLVVVCTLSPLHILLLCTASKWMSLSLPLTHMSFAFSYCSPKHTLFESACSTASLSSHQQHSPDLWASDPMYHCMVSDGLYAMFTYTFEEQGYLSDDEPLREGNKLHCCCASLEQDCTDELHLEVKSPSPAAEQPQELHGDRT